MFVKQNRHQRFCWCLFCFNNDYYTLVNFRKPLKQYEFIAIFQERKFFAGFCEHVLI